MTTDRCLRTVPALILVGALAWLAAPLCAQTVTPVTISDTIASAVGGQQVVGSITLTWPAFTEPNNQYIAAGNQTINLGANGQFSVQLYPTTQASEGGTVGGVVYSVQYNLLSGGTMLESWAVPETSATLTIANVLVPVPAELRGPTGTTNPSECKTGDLFYNAATAQQEVCVSPNTWAAIVTSSQATLQFLNDPGGNGIVYRDSQGQTRIATQSDLTTLLGYTPMNPSSDLSEIAGSASAARTNLGLGTAATHPATDFLLSSLLGGTNGVAELDGTGHVPTAELPALSAQTGQLNLSQINIAGTASASTFLNGANGWEAIPYSAITGTPGIPSDDAQIGNSLGYVKSSQLATVATTGKYTDLLNLPTYGDIVTHNASDFLGALLLNSANGVAPLDANKLLPLANLPTIPSTQISGLGTAATEPASNFLAASALGAHSGAAELDANGLLLSAELPAISYSSLTNLPTIPTETSQLTNNSGFITSSQAAAAAPVQNVEQNGTSVVTSGVANVIVPTDDAQIGNSKNYITAGQAPVQSIAINGGSPNTGAVNIPVPTALSQLTNDANFITSAQAPVQSVNGQTGAVTITPYTLPEATATTLGGVECGANLTCTAGVMSAAAPYTLPAATTSTLGGVIAGSELTVSAGVLSVNAAAFDPAGAATSAVVGLLKASNNLSDLGSVATAKTNLGLATVASTGSYSDLINKPTIPPAYTLPAATSSTLGGVICGTNLTCAVDGTISAANPYTLPIATAAALGGILVGTDLSINATTGALSVNAAAFDPVGAATTAEANALQKANNLSDLASVATAKTNLGLATVASSGSYTDLINQPVLGTIASHNVGDFMASTLLGAHSGAAELDANGILLTAEMPTITAAEVTGLGTAATEPTSYFLLASQLNAASGVAPLDTNKLIPLANLPTIPYASISGTPVLAAVATTGAYSSLTGTPTALPPDGAAGGDLSGTYPNPSVVAINGQNIKALGAGILSVDANGVPHLATSAQVQSAFGYTPLNAANNLSDLANVATARTNLGLGTAALDAETDFAEDPGSNGIIYRTGANTSRVAAAADINALLGYTPMNNAVLGAANGAAELDANSHLLAAELPTAIPFADLTGVPSYVLTSQIGTANGVAELNASGQVPAAEIPTGALATTFTTTGNTTNGSVSVTVGSATGIAAGEGVSGPGIPANDTVASISGTTVTLAAAATQTATNVTLQFATAGTVIAGGDLALSGNGVLSVTASAFDPAGAASAAVVGLLKAANNLSDLADIPTARTNLGLGTAAVDAATAFAADPGANGIVYRTAAGTARVATTADVNGLIGYTPMNGAILGAASGAAELNSSGQLLSAELPAIPSSDLPIGSATGLGIVEAGSYLSAAAGVLSVNVGTTASTVAVGNDSRITGAIQSSALGQPNGPAVLDTTGKIEASEYGANIPVGDITGLGSAAIEPTTYFLLASQLDAANGAASLDSAGHVPLAELPSDIPYSDITGGPTQYVLPAATTSVLGGVSVSTGLAVTAGGALSVTYGTTSGTALQGSLLGAANGVAELNASSDIPTGELPVGVANGIANLDGTVHVPASELPPASASSVGAVSVPGSGGLTVTGGGALGVAYGTTSGTALEGSILGANSGAAELDSSGHLLEAEMPSVVNATEIQGNLVKAGTPAGGQSYIWNATNNDFELGTVAMVPATTSTLGDVIVGTGLGVNGGGTLSVNYGTAAGTALQGSLLGAASGVAPLDSSSHVPSANINFGTTSGQVLGGSLYGTNSGVAELDSTGNVPTSELGNVGSSGTVTVQNWSETIASISAGANTVTLAPCPVGVNGSDSNLYVYISGGTGTAEAVHVTGGTCTSGAPSGTIAFTAANNHTGSSLSSASGGIYETIMGNRGHAVYAPAGHYVMHACQTWYLNGYGLYLHGDGFESGENSTSGGAGTDLDFSSLSCAEALTIEGEAGPLGTGSRTSGNPNIVELSHLDLRGAFSTTGGDGLYLPDYNQSAKVTLDSVEIEGFAKNGVNTAQAYELHIVDNSFIIRNGQWGVHLNGQVNLTVVRDSYINDNSEAGNYGNFALSGAGSGSFNVNLLLINSDFEEAGQYPFAGATITSTSGAWIDNVASVTIENCYFEANLPGTSEIMYGSNVYSITEIGNTIDDGSITYEAGTTIPYPVVSYGNNFETAKYGPGTRVYPTNNALWDWQIGPDYNKAGGDILVSNATPTYQRANVVWSYENENETAGLNDFSVNINGYNEAMYRLTLYMDTRTVATAGTLNFTLNYNDLGGARTITDSLDLTTLGYKSDTWVFFTKGAAMPTYSLMPTGVTGSPKWDHAMTIERLWP